MDPLAYSPTDVFWVPKKSDSHTVACAASLARDTKPCADEAPWMKYGVCTIGTVARQADHPTPPMVHACGRGRRLHEDYRRESERDHGYHWPSHKEINTGIYFSVAQREGGPAGNWSLSIRCYCWPRLCKNANFENCENETPHNNNNKNLIDKATTTKRFQRSRFLRNPVHPILGSPTWV